MTPPTPTVVVPPPRRARAFLLAGTICAALLLVFYAVTTAPNWLVFDVGVDNREPDWVLVESIQDSATLVLADGQRWRVLPGDGQPTAPLLDELLEWDVRNANVYAEIERGSGPDDNMRMQLHYGWARCGNSFQSSNPFAEVPHYKPYARYAVERLGDTRNQTN